MLAGIGAGQDRGAGGGAGGVDRVGAIEAGAARGKPVEIGRLDLGVSEAQGIPVLLVAGDQEYVPVGYALVRGRWAVAVTGGGWTVDGEL